MTEPKHVQSINLSKIDSLTYPINFGIILEQKNAK